ncbi:hypothetical protein NE865_16548 [Phthorimaea operculella]|nr:hypothetical protein NE865_16548 [Phthorimaea operculella]
MDSESYTKIHQNTPTTKRVSTSSAIWHDDDYLGNPTLSESSITLFPPPSSEFEVFSCFGEQDCGEPPKPQDLVFDFTPDPEIDTEEAQLKCIAFWDFVNSQPLLRSMCVEPEPTFVPGAVPKPDPPIKAQVNTTPAVDVLNKNAHNFIEAACRHKNKCDIDDDSYSDIGKTKPVTGKWTAPKSMSTCSTTSPSFKKSKANKKPKPKQTNQESVKKMNQMLDEWDEKHPKSMEPPGPLMRSKPVMQRLLPQDHVPKTCLD